MTELTYALIKEQGITFAAVIVKDHVVTCQHTGSELIAGLEPTFGCPVVLRGERNGRWLGRRDIVNFMARVHPSRVRWMRGHIH